MKIHIDQQDFFLLAPPKGIIPRGSLLDIANQLFNSDSGK